MRLPDDVTASAATCAPSRTLVRRGPRIAGASDASSVPAIEVLIMMLIFDRPLCVGCIAARAQVSTLVVTAYLGEIGKASTVQSSVDVLCRTCETPGKTYAVAPMD
jgi:hypothetical protein